MSSSGGQGSSSSKTAGIIIIGDEVLKGQVVDTNSPYLIKELYKLGIRVRKVSVIGDGLDEIAGEVRGFSESFDYVLTTGGVGPTFDDITYQGVGAAFSLPITLNQTMLDMIRIWLKPRGYPEEVSSRMALMPEGAELIFDPAAPPGTPSFPITRIRNVFVFPGIPSLVRKQFPRLIGGWLESVDFYAEVIYVDKDELSLTPIINQIVEEFQGRGLSFGSYPVVGNLYYSTRLTMEGFQEGPVMAALAAFHDKLPAGSILEEYDPEPLKDAGEKVYKILGDPGHPLYFIRKAVSVIEEGLTKYPLDQICIGFTGGKDCTVLLHLLHAVVQAKCPEFSGKLRAMFIKYDDPFPEMETFIKETRERYGLEMWEADGPMKSGLEGILKSHSEINAVLLGTRRTDPRGSSLEFFQMTDPGWPQVLRVSPLLDWSYSQVWSFIRSMCLPYCSLYDRGYTSIGSKSNTKPNEELLDPSGLTSEGKPRYKPAYTLKDTAGERNGRK